MLGDSDVVHHVKFLFAELVRNVNSFTGYWGYAMTSKSDLNNILGSV